MDIFCGFFLFLVLVEWFAYFCVPDFTFDGGLKNLIFFSWTGEGKCLKGSRWMEYPIDLLI